MIEVSVHTGIPLAHIETLDWDDLNTYINILSK
jgi:hypothetical protein